LLVWTVGRQWGAASCVPAQVTMLVCGVGKQERYIEGGVGGRGGKEGGEGYRAVSKRLSKWRGEAGGRAMTQHYVVHWRCPPSTTLTTTINK
jgi:hypothetical protein